MKTLNALVTTKTIVVITSCVIWLTGCATSHKPLSTIKLTKIKTTDGGNCLVKLDVYNGSPDAWREFQPYMIFRDPQKQIVGEMLANTIRYTEPGRGLSQQRIVKNTRCDQIHEATVLEFTYLDNAGIRYRVNNSRIVMSLD